VLLCALISVLFLLPIVTELLRKISLPTVPGGRGGPFGSWPGAKSSARGDWFSTLALVIALAAIFEFVTAFAASFAFVTAPFAIFPLATAFAAIFPLITEFGGSFALVTAFEAIFAAVTALFLS
jgi:hypothetical protein